MAQRIARAVLALLCAVAVVYGTALFPAAFDAELRPEQPGVNAGPSTPAEQTARDPESDSSSVTDTSTPTSSTATAGPTDTATPTPVADENADDSGGVDSGLGWGSGLLLVTFVGVAVALALGLRSGGERGSSVLSGVPLLGRLTRLSLPSLHRLPQVTTLVIITAGGGLARVAEDASTVASAVLATVAGGLGPVVGALSRSLTTVPRALGKLLSAPVRTAGAAATLFGGLGFLGSVSRPSFGGADTPDTDARSEREPAPGAEDDDAEPIGSVLDAWAAMTDLVPVRNPEATTAAEYARTAVDAGLPAAPVERLTALFREVRYGGRTDSDDRVSAARRALDALTGGDD